MSSFDPREWGKKEEIPASVSKLPLQRLEPTLRKFTEVAIPTDLERLRKHQINIERHIYSEAWHSLNVEQINASRTVQQLRATIREMDKTKNQIREEDLDLFEKRIAPTKKQAVGAIQSFGNLEKTLMQKLNNKISVPEQDVTFKSETTSTEQDPLRTKGDLTIDEAAASASWDDLRESLVDLGVIINDFSTLVHQQQDKVDSISDNIEKSHENVKEAAIQLGHASKLKTAMIPIAGAIVGGLVAGPIGLLAGFKLAGLAAAVGGTVVGYQGGKMFKKKRDRNIDGELEHLSSKNVEMKTIKDKSA